MALFTRSKVTRLRDDGDVRGLIDAATVELHRKHWDLPAITACVDALVELGPPGLDALVAAVRGPDERLRLFAAGALQRAKDPRTVAPLAGALHDTDAGVREAAASALSHLSDPTADEALAAALSDPAAGVRKVAAYALVERGDPRAVDELTEIARRDPRRFAERLKIWLSFAEHPLPPGVHGPWLDDPAPVAALVAVLRPVLAAVPAVGDAVLHTGMDPAENRHALQLIGPAQPIHETAVLAGLHPLREDDAAAVFARLGVPDPSRYPDAVRAFGGFCQHALTSAGAPVEVTRLRLAEGAAGDDFVFVHLADRPPLGFLVCALAGGGFLGSYRPGTELRQALGL